MKFKIWNKHMNLWDKRDFCIRPDGKLMVVDIDMRGYVLCNEKDLVIVRASSLKDHWLDNPKTDEPTTIYEGDIVYLHDWGLDSVRIIGVAQVIYDDECHRWDFKMLDCYDEDNNLNLYIESSYDRFRQSPQVIGNIYEPNEKGEYLVAKDWQYFLKNELVKADVLYKKKELQSRMREIKKKEKELFSEKTKHDEEVSKLKIELKEQREKLKELDEGKL